MIRRKPVLYLLLFILGFSLVYFLRPATKETISNATNAPKEPLGFFTTVETPKGIIYLYINQDYINLNVVETPYYPKAPVIRKENYPKLFKQGIADSSALRAEYYKESKDGKTYIKLSNIQPDHGGYVDTYAILVDPFTGMEKESKSIDKVSGKANF